ncbi:hypothetical protein EV363DRAFT_1497668, partial [Boletus edulis]
MMCRQPAMTILDPQTFAASTLADSEGRTAALKMLESCLAGPDIPLDLIVQDLCSVPNLFESIVSALPSAEKLVHRILDTYPTDPALVDASSAGILLRRLSSIMFALPPDSFSTNIFRYIGRYKVYVEDAFPVLPLLLSTEFSTCITPTSPLEDPEYDDEEFSGFLVRYKKQKKPKRKIKYNAPAIDMAPFHKLGSKVPLSNAEASQMARDVTDDLKMILKFYLELLLEPSLAQHLMNAYVSTCDKDVHPSAPQETQVTEVVGQKPSGYPKVQPVKAGLYFENANGFGEWRIIIGTDATKKLKGLATDDRKKCAIVVKKIKQLSNGHFSDENQKRLNDSSEVPIFEAKIQRDLGLVYQVDVVPDHDGETNVLVIKIYDVYTHTQLNRIWDALGQHLAGKGEEYRQRCIFRNSPAHPGSDVYFPACFPPEELQNATKPVPPVLSNEDMEGTLRALYSLDKYVTFSQAFLHSLIANQDVQHVFELTQQERRIMECKTSCYVLGRSGTGKTTTMLFKMLGIQRAWEMQTSGMPKPRQIFVTKSRVLATKVEEYFVKLLESLALAGYSLQDLKRMQTRDTDSGLVDVDDQERADIPQRYSALEENHFPLFVTFDQLAKMIAVDVLSGDDPEARHLAKYFINTAEVRAQDSFVTYGVFARTYWPRFPQRLTKGLEPWLVFSELMGIIKGSEKSLSCPGGFLHEEAYCNLSSRSNPAFANQRTTVYAIFKAYCKLKKERRHHDVADRTHAILKTLLGGGPLKGQRVDFLYIDEAQDNLLIDALLLRLICRNPEGLFWAGDTAQTISAGSSFRFNELKAFLYRIERDQSAHLIQDRSVTDPTAFQLATNYRSHRGIVDCAHTIIERITHFWPDSIDVLQPEYGIVNGLKPMFLRGGDQDTVRYEQFLFGGSGSRIEFGAQQCILVRDDEAVEKLRKEVGEIGLIMTLYDSKGLEFNDVLLYNFFEDSAVDVSRWRGLLNHVEGEVDGQDLAEVYAPSFSRDDCRFARICCELKLLYVGITRARKNLWIFDKSDKSEPMRMIWTSRNQVQNCTPGTDVPRLAVSSPPEEWESFGHDLFKHKKYPQAMHCFARALLPRMVAICEAFHLRELARAKVGVAPPKAQQDAFLTAADAFVESAEDAPPGNAKFQYYRNAAECYVRAGDDRKAADAYLDAKEYDLAARRYRKVGLFDETLEILHKHSRKMESSEELYTVCRLFYCSKDVNRPRLPLFPSFEEELGFLEDYDLDFARATLLENHGKYMEAAELHLSENRPLDAIGDLLMDKGSRDAVQQAAKIILDGLWRRCSFGIPSEEVAVDLDVVNLLKLANELPVEFLDPLDHDEISIFRAIAHADLPNLEKLSHAFIENRKAAALLALDHFFNRLPVLESYTLQEMTLFLDKFRTYARLLREIISHPDPLSLKSIRRLFCITEISSTEYGMELGSFLHRSATGDPHGPMYLQPAVLTISKREMVTMLWEYLAGHLCERVTQENELCYNAVVFSQCLTFIVNGQCNRFSCPQEHVNSADLDSKRYNLRIGIHLQQICILQLMYSVNPRVDRRNCVLYWLTHLYEAFNTQSHVQGSTADLDLSMIPGAHDSIGVMKHWVRDALYALHENRARSAFLTNVLKLTSLIFAFDAASALTCIGQAQFNAHHARVQVFTYPDGRYVLEDIVRLFDGTQQTCISAGLLFLRHVIKSSLYLDLSVFCDCLEELVGKTAVSWRLSYNPPLDGLVLPRGWLASNKDFSSKKDTKIVLIVDVLSHVQELLMLLQSDSDAASRIYSLSHTRLTPMLRNVFASRICKALCLLTYNVRNIDVRHKVKSIFSALRAAGHPHKLYRKYVQARDNEYLEVMVEYDTEAKVVIEDLVQLLHKQRDPVRLPPLNLPRIQHIHFSNPSEVPSLLASQLVAARSDLRADAPAFVPQVAPASQMEKTEVEEKPRPEEPEPEPVDEVHEEPQELAPAPNEPVLSREHEPTEDEISAAEKIQAAYRTYRKHREAQANGIGKGLEAQRNRIFIACLKNASASNWGRTPYRTLYLRVLPHLIVYLDKAISVAHEFKSKTKGLLLNGDHERLEELGKQSNMIRDLVKYGHKLRKEIEPNAIMHQARDKAAMKRAVLDVKDFIYRLPTPNLAPDIRNDFKIAYDLVMVEEQPVSKPEKPTLNTEDLL